MAGRIDGVDRPPIVAVVVDEGLSITSQQPYAFDTVTDDERWASKIGATLVGSPTVADGTVYVGTAVNALTALSEG